MITEVTTENYLDFVKNEGLNIVKIGADWCGPCKMVAPILESVSEEPLTENVYIGDMNADKNPEKLAELNVRSIPTTIFYKNGTEINRYVGAYTKQQLEEMIKTYSK